jgi:hypothetical protein
MNTPAEFAKTPLATPLRGLQTLEENLENAAEAWLENDWDAFFAFTDQAVFDLDALKVQVANAVSKANAKKGGAA